MVKKRERQEKKAGKRKVFISVIAIVVFAVLVLVCVAMKYFTEDNRDKKGRDEIIGADTDFKYGTIEGFEL